MQLYCVKFESNDTCYDVLCHSIYKHPYSTNTVMIVCFSCFTYIWICLVGHKSGT